MCVPTDPFTSTTFDLTDVEKLLKSTSFTVEDMDRAYQDGVEDLAIKTIELIQQFDDAITPAEIISFLEAEIGFQEEFDTPDDIKDPQWYLDNYRREERDV